MKGALLGNYRVVEQLSESSMGAVYLGRHETLGRPVVVKVLQPELSRNGDMVQRFFNEAQAATAIRNPGIVQVFDFGTTPEGRAFLVMELLEGESLAVRLRQRRLDHLECCRIGRQIANVLQAAHAAGITHRDLKPPNLFLARDPEVIGGERVKVLDFGLAKLASEAHDSGIKTRTGLMMGSPTYMSPEQCRSLRTADARSDIYALGCILFEMACGRPPFIGHGMGDIVSAHIYRAPPSPQSFAPDMPPELSSLIAQMLEKAPDARPQTMAAVSQALDEIVRALGGGAPARPSTPPPVRPAPAQPAQPAHAADPALAATGQPAIVAGRAFAAASAGPAPAVTLPPDAVTAPPTLPRPMRPQAPSPGHAATAQPARPPTAQPARPQTPPPAPPESPEPTLHEPTLYETTQHGPPQHDATDATAPSSTMVLSELTLMPVSEPTMSDPTLMPMSDGELRSPRPARAPTPSPASASPPSSARAPTPSPGAGSAPSPAFVAAPYPASTSAPSQAAAPAPWPAPNAAPPQPGGPTPWPPSNAAPPQANGHASFPVPGSPMQPGVGPAPWQATDAAPPPAIGAAPWPAPATATPFAYPATPSPAPQSAPAAPTSGDPSNRPGPQPNVAALQRAFVRGGLAVVGGVVAIAFALGTCNSDSPERQGTMDAPRPADAAVAIEDAAGAAAQPPAPPTAPTAAAAAAASATEPRKSPATSEALESECRGLQENRKWAELEQCADKLQPLDAKRAAELKTRAAEEAKAAPRIAAFDAALRDKNLRRARAELDQIWAESVERPELKRKYESAETQAIAELTAQLQRVKSADCAAYNALLAKERPLTRVSPLCDAVTRVCAAPSRRRSREWIGVT